MLKNPLPWPRREAVVARLPDPGPLCVAGPGGDRLPTQVLSRSPEGLEVAFLPPEIPPFGAVRLYVERGAAAEAEVPEGVRAGAGFLESRQLRVSVGPEGTLTARLSREGLCWPLLHALSPRPPGREGRVRGPLAGESGRFLVGSSAGGPLVGRLEIEGTLAGIGTFVTRVELRYGSRWLRLRTLLAESRPGACLEVLFPGGSEVDRLFFEGAEGLVVEPLSGEYRCQPFQRLCGLAGRNRSLALLAPGFLAFRIHRRRTQGAVLGFLLSGSREYCLACFQGEISGERLREAEELVRPLEVS